MTRKLLLAALLAGTMAGCDQPASPSGLATAPDGPSAVWNTSTDTLGVSISGPFVASTAGGYNYTATVTGGSGTYLYYWFYRWCDQAGCETTYAPLAYGQGVSTATLNVRSGDWQLEVGVQVNEYESNRSGKRYKKVMGPSPPPEPKPVSAGYSCTAPAINYNLYHRENNENGVSTVYYYRRQWCTNNREWWQGSKPPSFQ